MAFAEPLDDLVSRACERAGLDDFGGDSWREGLEMLVETCETAPGVNPGGREFVYGQFATRCGIACASWTTANDIPRWPTSRCSVHSWCSACLAQAHRWRVTFSTRIRGDGRLLTWEAEDSVPPSTPDTLRTDPRCSRRRPNSMSSPKGSRPPTSRWCTGTRPTGQRSACCPEPGLQGIPLGGVHAELDYADWLLETDMTSAYEYQRMVLQMFQSPAPGTWSLKMPSHAVHIEALLATFPDARIVWAHRDPFKSTASFLRLNYLSRAVLGCAVNRASSFQTCCASCTHMSRDRWGLRERIGDDRFFDLHYSALTRDPVGVMRALYAWAATTSQPHTEAAMLDWLDRIRRTGSASSPTHWMARA